VLCGRHEPKSLAGEQRRTQAETGPVFFALFSPGVLRDMDKWGAAGRTVEIVIPRNPDCRMCSVEGNGFDPETWFVPLIVSSY